jgi:hypothetical protein
MYTAAIVRLVCRYKLNDTQDQSSHTENVQPKTKNPFALTRYQILEIKQLRSKQIHKQRV